MLESGAEHVADVNADTDRGRRVIWNLDPLPVHDIEFKISLQDKVERFENRLSIFETSCFIC